MQKITGESWFASYLNEWYEKHKRSLPWRLTDDPYLIWISEIILQQTRVDQGLPYYMRFVETFSTVHELAEASEDEVLRCWQGLGYYSRAKNLHATAKQLVNDYGGRFPSTYDELLQLKGIGPYTASAIASFSFKQPYAVVDGNVFRVLSRVFGVETPINSTEGKRQFTELAQSLIDVKRPDLYNQAIMEFGALQCTPKNVQCDHCILLERCSALASRRVADLPIKLKKTNVKPRSLHYFAVEDSLGRQRLIKRDNKGLWAGLYEFPSIELGPKESVTDGLVSELFGSVQHWSIVDQTPLIHKLSHQELSVYLYRIQLDRADDNGIDPQLIKDFPCSALMQKLLKRLNFYYL